MKSIYMPREKNDKKKKQASYLNMQTDYISTTLEGSPKKKRSTEQVWVFFFLISEIYN